MNHYRTFFFLVIISLFLGPSTLWGKLNRELKPSEISTLHKNIAKNPATITSRLFLADHYYAKKNWKFIRDVLSPVVEQLPDRALYQLSTSYMKLKELQQSEAIISILLNRPSAKTKHRLLAVEIYSGIIDELQQSEKSIEWTEKLFNSLKLAQKLDPTNRKIYDTWLAKLEKYIPPYAAEALRVMEDMRKNDIVFNKKDYSRFCKYNHMASFTSAAEVSCQQAILKDPKNPSNHIFLAQTQIHNGEEEKGRRRLASVGKKFSHSEEALWATASSYYENKDLPSAYNYYKKATQHKNAKPRDFLGLAKTAFELKKYDTSLNSFIEHCRRTSILDHEFRRASGLLKSNPKWQNRFRQKMMDCKP